MAIFVIAIHTHPFGNVELEILQKIYSTIVSIAVPFFFISSGFLVFNKMENFDNIKIRKYLLKLIRLYLIYMPLTIYDYANNNHSLIFNVWLFIRGLFFIGEHYNSWILWYLLSLIYSMLLIGILITCKIRIRVIYLISVLLFIFANIMTIWVNNIDILHGFIQTPTRYFQYCFSNGRLFTGMFYVMTGVIISKYKNDIYILFYIGLMLFWEYSHTRIVFGNKYCGVFNNSILINYTS
jgi:surface polysaccharide O-acyltransferase-like enzyme